MLGRSTLKGCGIMGENGIRESVFGRMLEQTLPYATAASEDRSAPRHEVQIAATLRPSGESAFKVTVTNLSSGGFACHALTRIPKGARCWLTLPGLSGLQAEVAWNDGRMVGGAFTNLLATPVLDSIVSRFGTARR
jgi:hypothetical protein